jgi:hypothetical protein
MRAGAQVLDSRGLGQVADRVEAQEDGQRPPGQFVSDEHEADCTRFLEEVKEFVRRRREAGLGRDR